ncbi:MAG: family 78 glycoside hydrolase catalytic domain, partial [Mycetocola sp.]
VRVIETVEVAEKLTSASGTTILDFGQNLVGWLRIRLTAEAGRELTLRHAEVLENGELGVRPLRFAAATDHYTTSGVDGGEEWTPRFTFHGFRYAEITGIDAAQIEVVAEVIHSDMERTGWFESDHAGINQLHSNAVWGMRGNVVGVPTDCPQRDERLGWSGDIQVFAPAASFLYNSDAFLGNWLQDLAADQARQGGIVPLYSPQIQNPLFPVSPVAAWGDAASIIPWTLWERYADRELLERQYPSAKSWVDLVLTRLTGDLWQRDFQLGDWLDPTAPPENPAKAQTAPDLVATAHAFRSTLLLSRSAAVLGLDDDAAHYAARAEQIRSAFQDAYVTPGGRMVSDAQTAYALAIAFEIVTEPERVAALGERLAEIVRSHGFRIGTGFVGTPIVCDALAASGQTDVAYRLLTETGCPSWLYSVSMGATTIWERWDSMLPDGSINPGEMTSFNHYALGAVVDWMHRDIAGLAPAAPGYAEVLVRPRPGIVQAASATHLSGYGEISVSWRIIEGEFSLDVVVPPNTSATIQLPDGSEPQRVGSGSHRFSCAAPVAEAPAPWGWDSSLGDIVANDEARAVFDAFCERVGVGSVEGWAADGRWSSAVTLADGFPFFPVHLMPELVEDLAVLNERQGLITK